MYKNIIALVALAAIVLVLPHKTWVPKNILTQTSGAARVLNEDTNRKPEYIGPQMEPDLAAKSALAIDLRTGTRLYEKNIDTEIPIASLTKLMTAMVVLDHVNKDEIVTIQPEDTATECSCMGLQVGERISVENLLKGMLIPSNNDAAKALARFVGGTREQFAEYMNQKTKALGLERTHYSNPAGLDSINNYSTASDLSKVTLEFLKYSLLERIVATGGEDVYSADGQYVHHLKTSNKLLLENSEVVGVKTGFTNEAQGNLILKIDHNGIEVLTLVLNTPNREDDTKKLIDWVYKAYRF